MIVFNATKINLAQSSNISLVVPDGIPVSRVLFIARVVKFTIWSIVIIEDKIIFSIIVIVCYFILVLLNCKNVEKKRRNISIENNNYFRGY